MILFFGDPQAFVFAVQVETTLPVFSIEKLHWLFGHQPKIEQDLIDAEFIGPRAAMISPWSTNAVEITQNMSIEGIRRIEKYVAVQSDKPDYDPMLFQHFTQLNQDIFSVEVDPDKVIEIKDIAAYNESEGLALNKEEVAYLEALAEKIGRKLTDSEVFGFSQVNSEHCRHKIFNTTLLLSKVPKSYNLHQKEQTVQIIMKSKTLNRSFQSKQKPIIFRPLLNHSTERPQALVEKLEIAWPVEKELFHLLVPLFI